MIKFLLPFLILAQPTTLPDAIPDISPMSAELEQQIQCVATFAIVAAQQEKGAIETMEYPPMAERGKEFAGIVGEQAMQQTGQSREAVRDLFIKAVAEEQNKTAGGEDAQAILDERVETCLPVLDSVLAPQTKPTLNQCAGLLELAYREVYAREKLSKKAQDLKTLAFVLDSRAREQMRSEGKSGSESDVLLETTREAILAQEKQDGAPALDIDHCFTLAAPEKKQQNFEH